MTFLPIIQIVQAPEFNSLPKIFPKVQTRRIAVIRRIGAGTYTMGFLGF